MFQPIIYRSLKMGNYEPLCCLFFVRQLLSSFFYRRVWLEHSETHTDDMDVLRLH